MSTTLAPPPATAHQPALVASSVARLREENEIHLEALEQILLKKAARTKLADLRSTHAVAIREFTSEERLVFASLRLSDMDIVREWNRCEKLRDAKAAAGTSAEREADRAKASQATAEYDHPKTGAAQLRARAAELLRQADALEQARDRAHEAVSQREKAIRELIKDCVDENLLPAPRRNNWWPSCGVLQYVEEHVGPDPTIAGPLPAVVLEWNSRH